MPSGITPMIVQAVSLSWMRPAEDGGIAGVAVLPDAVAEDDDRGGASGVLAGREVAPEQRLLAEQAEKCWR